MRKKFDVLEERTKTQVDQAYKEYQEFMKVAEMPKYNFMYSNQRGSTVAEAIYRDNRYDLIIVDTLCTTYKAGAKGILFHEFTHILDEEELVNAYGFPYEDRNIKYVYKELHAEQIRALFLLGCKNVDDLSSINADNKAFMYGRELYNIHDYLLSYQNELSRDISVIEAAKRTNTKISMYEFNNIINRILYYIGTASVYIKFCDTNSFDELSIQEVYNYYGCDLHLLIRVLLEQPIGFHTKEIVEAMALIRKRIMVHFGGDLKIIDFSV